MAHTIETMNSHFVAGIFARGGSKGLPGKNLMSIGGRSLMERAVSTAKELSFIEAIYCSTDSPAIASEAARSGALVPWYRPVELAQDDSREWDSWVHLISWLNSQMIFPDYLMTVPLTAPLRTKEDLLACANVAEETGADVVLGIYESSKNPWFTMVTRDENSGQVNLVIKPKERINNRQQAPKCYDVAPNTFIIRCDFLLRAQSIYDGDTRGVLLPRENCVDIDSDFDFTVAEALLRQRESK